MIQNIPQTTPQMPATQTLPQATLQHLKNLAKYNPSALQDIPQDSVQQLNLTK